jgi:hypothetical protein
MSGLEVGTVVSSIIAAFGNGMDLFKKMRAKAKAKKQDKHGAKLTQDELRLRQSLRRGPEQIRAEYDKNVARLGQRFQIGDPIAHSSLAHTLIVLNTGLVNILKHALSEDSKAREMSKTSLLGLSELATADTINALGQLNKRLMSVSSPISQPQPYAAAATTTAATTHGKKTKTAQQQDRTFMAFRVNPPQAKEKTRPSPDPLARGGWVRSKSGTSMVSSASSNPRPAKKKRSHSSPFPAKGSPLNQPDPIAPDPHPHPAHGNSPCVCRARVSNPRHDIESRQDDPQADAQSQLQELDLLLASPDVFNADSLPPRPPKIPLEWHVPSRKPRPPSVATFLTASTKIGEIPEHRWLDRPALPWDDRPLPYVIPPPLEPEPVKRKARGFKSWWKSGSRDERSAKSEVQV